MYNVVYGSIPCIAVNYIFRKTILNENYNCICITRSLESTQNNQKYGKVIKEIIKERLEAEWSERNNQKKGRNKKFIAMANMGIEPMISRV